MAEAQGVEQLLLPSPSVHDKSDRPQHGRGRGRGATSVEAYKPKRGRGRSAAGESVLQILNPAGFGNYVVWGFFRIHKPQTSTLKKEA